MKKVDNYFDDIETVDMPSSKIECKQNWIQYILQQSHIHYYLMAIKIIIEVYLRKMKRVMILDLERKAK